MLISFFIYCLVKGYTIQEQQNNALKNLYSMNLLIYVENALGYRAPLNADANQTALKTWLYLKIIVTHYTYSQQCRTS